MDREDAGNLCAPMCVWHREERENTNSLWEQSDEENRGMEFLTAFIGLTHEFAFLPHARTTYVYTQAHANMQIA